MSCFICKNKNAAYKCAKCRIQYCSVDCYRIHKNTNCEAPIIETWEEPENTKFTTDNTVPVEKLKLLADDPGLREILSNKHVRDILKNINSCNNYNEMLEQAMKEPIFVEFIDSCLKITDKR